MTGFQSLTLLIILPIMLNMLTGGASVNIVRISDMVHEQPILRAHDFVPALDAKIAVQD
jgi:hypothetical protein